MCGVLGRSGGDCVIVAWAGFSLALPRLHAGCACVRACACVCVSLMCMCARYETSPGLANPPWRSYHWSLPGLSLCSGERKGHFEVSPLL